LFVVVKLVAIKLPLNAIVLLEFDKLIAPAATFPLKLVPAELAIVKLPLPAKEEAAIKPVVPAFKLKMLPALVTVPTVILLPTVDAPAFVVSNEDVPVKVTAFKSIAAALVSTAPLMVLALTSDVTPLLNKLVFAKVTPSVLENVTALVIVLPAFSSTL
jgi:hypothetical protein